MLRNLFVSRSYIKSFLSVLSLTDTHFGKLDPSSTRKLVPALHKNNSVFVLVMRTNVTIWSRSRLYTEPRTHDSSSNLSGKQSNHHPQIKWSLPFPPNYHRSSSPSLIQWWPNTASTWPHISQAIDFFIISQHFSTVQYLVSIVIIA